MMARSIVALSQGCALGLVAVLAAGCFQTVRLTPELIHDDGRVVLAAPPEKVFQAAQEALAALNIGVAVAKPDQGLIVSKRFTLSTSAVASGYSASLVEDTLQYELLVKGIADGKTELIASPKAFRNAREMTDEKVWILDGQYGQRPRWQRLFGEVRRMLGEPAAG
jgi:hypothetical protein